MLRKYAEVYGKDDHWMPADRLRTVKEDRGSGSQNGRGMMALGHFDIGVAPKVLNSGKAGDGCL